MIFRTWIAALAALALGHSAVAAQETGHERRAWQAAWASSQMIPQNENALSPDALNDATLRQTVRLTAAGDQLRVRLSNLFGQAPLTVAAARVALPETPGGSAIRPETDRPLTFAGAHAVVIPPGAEYLSDPVPMTVAAGAHMVISLHTPQAPDRQTGHPGSRATTWLAPGDQTARADLTAAESFPRWHLIAAVEVMAPASSGAVVILGDSITDGYGVQPDTDSRWPDFLAARMHADPATQDLSIINQGIGGNRVLSEGLGPNALARFDRDVLGVAGVRHLIILEGVNDLGALIREGPATPEAYADLVRRITGAYAQMADRARARGVQVIGATILPFGGSDFYRLSDDAEAARQAINAWIRAPGHFDAVIDFDAIMRDPDRPTHLNPAYDNDGLHPSIAGYQAMGEAVPLSLFAADAGD